MFDAAMEPQEFTNRLLGGMRISRLVWIVARYRIADLIGDGTASADRIAELAGLHAEPTRRMLDALASVGIFRSEGDGVYAQTTVSSYLRSDHPRSQRAWMELSLGGPHLEAWADLETTMRTGQTAFEVRHGMSWIDFNVSHPEAGRIFTDAMGATTRAYEDAIVEADPFPPFELAVDVGGSQGSLLRALLSRLPRARGIVLDLPEVIESWVTTEPDDLDGRLAGVGGDFFEAVPGGADLYLLKMILHDWDDDHAQLILRRVREAADSGSTVAIAEFVLPETPIEHPGWIMDVNMMVLTGGRERSAGAYACLLDRTGWEIDRIVQTASPISVILARPT